MDGYQVHDKVRGRASEPEISRLLADTHHLDREAIRRFESVDLGNARLRQPSPSDYPTNPPTAGNDPHLYRESPICGLHPRKDMLRVSWTGQPSSLLPS